MRMSKVMYVITEVLLVAAFLLYLANCSTAYYRRGGVSTEVIACTAAAFVLELGYLLLAKRMASPANGEDAGGFVRKMRSFADGEWLNLLPIGTAVISMAAFMQLLNLRIYSIATIMTFENNASNMADLRTTFAALVLYFAAVAAATVSQFFDQKQLSESER